MKIGAVIVGAGKGERLGGEVPKCLIIIDDVPLLLLAAYPFQIESEIAEVALVVPSGMEAEIGRLVHQFGFTKSTRIVPGGARRQDSVLAGLNSLSPRVDKVLIHDGARPLLSKRLLDSLIVELDVSPAVMPFLPVTDTLHLDERGYAGAGPSRTGLVAAQTPQGFDRNLLERAFKASENNAIAASDEASLVRTRMGVSAKLITGEMSNIKINIEEDLRFYAAQLRERAKLVKELMI